MVSGSLLVPTVKMGALNENPRDDVGPIHGS